VWGGLWALPQRGGCADCGPGNTHAAIGPCSSPHRLTSASSHKRGPYTAPPHVSRTPPAALARARPAHRALSLPTMCDGSLPSLMWGMCSTRCGGCVRRGVGDVCDEVWGMCETRCHALTRCPNQAHSPRDVGAVCARPSLRALRVCALVVRGVCACACGSVCAVHSAHTHTQNRTHAHTKARRSHDVRREPPTGDVWVVRRRVHARARLRVVHPPLLATCIVL